MAPKKADAKKPEDEGPRVYVQIEVTWTAPLLVCPCPLGDQPTIRLHLPADSQGCLSRPQQKTAWLLRIPFLERRKQCSQSRQMTLQQELLLVLLSASMVSSDHSVPSSVASMTKPTSSCACRVTFTASAAQQSFGLQCAQSRWQHNLCFCQFRLWVLGARIRSDFSYFPDSQSNRQSDASGF